MVEVDATHLRGVIVVPARVFFGCNGMRFLDAPGNSLNKAFFNPFAASSRSARFNDMSAAELGSGVTPLPAVLMPSEIVERTRRISHAPMCHDALGIVFKRLAEAFD